MIGNFEKSTWKNNGNIIVPGRFVEGSEIEIPGAKTFGRVRMEKFNRFGMKVAEREFDNLITNNGLNRCTPAHPTLTWYQYCMVGTGTAVPAFTDTALVAQVGSTTSASQTAGGAVASLALPGTVNFVFTFPLGSVVGNLTEVGLGTTATLCSVRALILDNLGNPVAFPVGSDEQLRVSYVRGHYAPQSDVVTTQTLSGTTYDVTIRATYVVGSFWPFGYQGGSASYYTIGTGTAFSAFGTEIPAGTNYNASSSANDTYINDSFQQDVQGSWAAGTATSSVLRMAKVKFTGMTFQMLYGTNLVKTAGSLLVLPYRIAWGRA